MSGTGSELESIHFLADGQRGWAAGGRGTLLATSDGGATWVAQISGTGNGFDSIGFLADGRHGWAAGDNGAVLATADGGVTWIRQASGTENRLSSIHLLADGEHGWAAGDKGALLATTTGGATWAAQVSGTKNWLRCVTFATDGQRGWAAGADGTLLASTDAGATWSPQASGTRNWIMSISFLADGQRGWAAGEGGAVLATTDGGKVWAPLAQPTIALPPWYFLALLFIGVGGIQVAIRGRFSGQDAGGAADVANNAEVAVRLLADTPVDDMANDRLNYRPTVEALSSFIRNAATQPHLTLAITGAWGQGKSSIMRMLKTDLEKANFRTAWFNAWHHQQEGRPMSALFNVIRKQATPKLFSRQFVSALRVRWRLLWGRGALYQGMFLLVLFGGLVAGRDFAQEHTYYGVPLTGWERLRWVAGHQLVGAQRLLLTPESISRLAPIETADKEPNSASTVAITLTTPITSTESPPAASTKASIAASGYRVRQQVIDYIKGALVAGTSGDTYCNDDRPVAATMRCIFDRPEDLYATVDANIGVPLSIDERRHLRAVAVKVPPPPLLPLMAGLLVPLAPLLGLLLTKGISVYGFQLLRPFSGLLDQVAGQDDNSEATGLIEHYRTEFALLTRALDGRLVLFIDDLDRCDKQTVNGLLELTNYLTDIGECFIVLGVAIEHIKDSISPPHDGGNAKWREEYPNEYLRKLIHIEVPVPHRAAHTESLFDPEMAVASPGAGAKLVQRLPAQWRKTLSALLSLPRRLPWGWLLRTTLIVGFLALGFPAFERLNSVGIGADQRIEARVATPPATTPVATTDPATADGGKTAPVDTPPPKAGAARLTTAARQPASTVLLIALAFVIGSLVVALARRRLAGVVASLNRALGGASRTFDSKAFIAAMKLWHPALVLHDPTPRGVKRFANRARLMSIYEQQSARAEKPPRPMTAEVQVVALTAIHQIYPDMLPKMVDQLMSAQETDAAKADGDRVRTAFDEVVKGLNFDFAAASNIPRTVTDTRATDPPPRELDQCFDKHLDTFGPPAVEDVVRICRRIQDLKVR